MKIPGFISYSHADGKILTQGLAKYLKNLFPNFHPIYDEDFIQGNELNKIPEELKLCNILIVIITPACVDSKQVIGEIQTAKKLRMKILPCKDVNVGKTWEELPPEFRSNIGLEFEDGDELKRKTYSALIKILESLSKELQDSIPKKTVAKKSIVPSQDEKIIAQKGFGGIQGFTLETKKKGYVISAGFDDNGEVLDVLLDRKSMSLIYRVDVPEDGHMRILLKRDLINATNSKGEEEKFFVLIDGEEVEHEEVDLDVDTRGIGVNVPNGAKEIEIIGTEIEGISYLGKVKQENIVKICKGSSVPGCEETKQCVEPETLEINIGDKVLWENNDSAAHTITSGSAADGPNGLFDSSLFMSGTTFEVTFTEEGEYPYFDMVHPWIAGKIIVK